jgi:hypothetical protein
MVDEFKGGTSSYAPGLGGIADREDAPTARSKGSTRDGSYRPNRPFRGEGMQVTLRRVKGQTRAGFLAHPFRFQTGPLDTLTREGERGWDTYTAIEDGEFPFSSGKKLRRPSFTVLLHDLAADWQVWNGSFDVQRMIRELEGIKENDVRFRLTIGQPALWGSTPLSSMMAVLTNVRSEQRGGEVGSEYVTLEFMQWRTQTLQAPGGTSRARSSDDARQYTLQKGDTLLRIARRQYNGDANAAAPIRKANSIPASVGSDDDDELAAWAKKHNRKAITLPGYRDEAVIGSTSARVAGALR